MTDFHTTSHLFAGNETYLAEMYSRFKTKPHTVSAEWVSLFETMYAPEGCDEAVVDDSSFSPRQTHIMGCQESKLTLSDVLQDRVKHKSGDSLEHLLEKLQNTAPAGVDPHQIRREVALSLKALMLIRAYRAIGHTIATLDPLGLIQREVSPTLDPAFYGFEDSEWDVPIFINNVLGLEHATLRIILEKCRTIYCGNIAVEAHHITDPEEKAWIQQRIEAVDNRTAFTELGKRTILERLTHADIFEAFLDKKFRGTKRFGLDGLEAVVPVIEQITKQCAVMGVEEIVLGMAHRGRLNVLANIMQKPYRTIFAEFSGTISAHDDIEVSGDVKYHQGTSADREFEDKIIHLSLTPNPSHLEAVNTVVLGKVRAKQTQRNDTERSKVCGLLLHGDAAFIGQGIVAETFLLSQLRGYRTGGTIHIAINNQIGFTTNTSEIRSSPYCTDLAKSVGAPVFHVNGDDPEACVHAARVVAEYRQKFKKDIVLDIWGYRRHGHNEGDEPKFTQPLMYQAIENHPRVRQVYAEKLQQEGVISGTTARNMVRDFEERLEAELEASQVLKPNKADWLEGQWQGLGTATGGKRRGETSVDEDLLREVGGRICSVPKNFNVHTRIAKQLESRKKAIDTGQGIDWGCAEALAFGTLLCESTSIRLSGEDSRRGTFSHRHAMLLDQKTEEAYVPLNHIRSGQAPFEVIDSPLSEFGLLGFEYGYANAEPHTLVLWEAQFGDFANGAQVIIDQFIASGETKWLRMCGLVMLLPHGYEGQGPEHSSARIERYLQLCAEDNMQVCNCTTPANLFHVLRRQVRRNFRKPLILMTPKSLLRHKRCVSSIEDFTNDSTFHRVQDDPKYRSVSQDPKVRRIVFCSGKIYYQLEEARDAQKLDIAIVRLEQIYPFPDDSIEEEMRRFPKAEVLWCQEEPENMGPWTFVRHRMEAVLERMKRTPSVRYVGRPEAASPATGSAQAHQQQQDSIIQSAIA